MRGTSNRERSYRDKPALHFHECEMCVLPHRWQHLKKDCHLTVSAACQFYLLRQPCFCVKTEHRQIASGGAV
jgi:hypothetical protein